MGNGRKVSWDDLLHHWSQGFHLTFYIHAMNHLPLKQIPEAFTSSESLEYVPMALNNLAYYNKYQLLVCILEAKPCIMNLDLHAQGKSDHVRNLKKEETKRMAELQQTTMHETKKKSMIAKMKDRFVKLILETEDNMYFREKQNT